MLRISAEGDIDLGSKVLRISFLNISFFINSTRGIGILIFCISASKLNEYGNLSEALSETFTSVEGAS
jgi:hypothetical protein